MYFSLPQSFVFLFDVLSVAVFVTRDRFIKKKADWGLNLYPCVIKYYLIIPVYIITLTCEWISVVLHAQSTAMIVSRRYMSNEIPVPPSMNYVIFLERNRRNTQMNEPWRQNWEQQNSWQHVKHTNCIWKVWKEGTRDSQQSGAVISLLFVFLFDVLSVAVLVITDRFVLKKSRLVLKS